MLKICSFCDVPFKDGEEISFIASTKYKQIPSKVAYALNSAFAVEDLYHKECLNYALIGEPE